ncbi:MAG: glycosyltransferase family 2 protein [Solirubrobacterales bacterium]
MEQRRPRVSIVIPNRNGVSAPDGLRYLDMVLSTLAEQTFRDFDVTVVDNGSTDGSVEYLAREWAQTRVIPMGENAGFPAAVNRGIASTKGGYVALLNNDLELDADWLRLLVEELDRDPGIGFVTGKIMRHDRRNVLEQVGLDLYTCGRFVPTGQDEPDTGQFDRRREIPMATGAAVLYRREAVERVGGFDEDYFLYCEDADLCLRMRLAGYRGVYLPAPEAYHVRGGTLDRASDLTRFYINRNAWITLLKDIPAATLWRSTLKILAYQVHLIREARGMGFARTLLRAYGSFLRSVPATLRKRRRVVRTRVLPPAELEAQLHTEYPIPTRFGRLLD